MRRTAPALVLMTVLLLALPGCGARGTPAPPVNAQDVMFTQMMIPHHRQGIEIAKLGAARGRSPEVRTLAAAVAATQQDEVEMMLRWLYAWEQPLTAPSGAHDHHGGMPETDRARIAALARSKAFDRDFLTLLMAHQDDAVRMAGTEAASGANPEARSWAERVRESRRAQIAQMRSLLRR
ncbi:hypothetical protein GCM10010149_58650 [Nonomuraea roseoviolacea subsp. roseoviolacea]|uniref:Uncharacterized protein (DUF305 family) n=1 Tax=Nonomuraea roseoviolacea subsp. carminata TaxID=160689 RepID=A0ABT1K0W8_9ACTN|nr:DUF305 domain-containing protein [Nonomuraea roseoviolacea]MCP2347640.1 uncharacterized protein (DUF305 family) [Nonomuraea roseoviolacea subsp. carminata]